jgi:hypothetical protein
MQARLNTVIGFISHSWAQHKTEHTYSIWYVVNIRDPNAPDGIAVVRGNSDGIAFIVVRNCRSVVYFDDSVV